MIARTTGFVARATVLWSAAVRQTATLLLACMAFACSEPTQPAKSEPAPVREPAKPDKPDQTRSAQADRAAGRFASICSRRIYRRCRRSRRRRSRWWTRASLHGPRAPTSSHRGHRWSCAMVCCSSGRRTSVGSRASHLRRGGGWASCRRAANRARASSTPVRSERRSPTATATRSWWATAVSRSIHADGLRSSVVTVRSGCKSTSRARARRRCSI